MFPFFTLLACSHDSAVFGNMTLSWDRKDATLQVTRDDQLLLDLRQLSIGSGSADITFQTGSYLFEEVDADLTPIASFSMHSDGRDGRVVADLEDEQGEALGVLQAWAGADEVMVLRMDAFDDEDDRSRMSFACTGEDAFLGAGEHAFDVDHQGEAFSLFVSEPGVGKTDSEEPEDDWFLTGTRHASSLPVPFLLRPDEPVGLSVATWSRLDLDLCSSDPDRFELTTWEPSLQLLVLGGDTPLDIVQNHTLATGGVRVPPDWAFAPWNDAVGGPERVEEVLAAIRSSGAPSGAIWSEDWRGGEELPVGYHPKIEWEVDRTLYTDPEGMDGTLAQNGIQWMAYFAPFVAEDSAAWAEAEDLLIQNPEGDGPYTFLGATLSTVSVLDLTDDDAWEWALEKMAIAVEVGFDGWMGDYGEWLPPDATMSQGDALMDHNAYATMWQDLNAAAIDEAAELGREITYFGRSGWWGVQASQPVHWAGDQRTSFDADDGFPTVLPLGLGASISGVAFFSHDIGGYQSVGNEASDRELWYRWCSLGAFTAIMRTHHGAFKDENWQFDTDEETLALWARYATEHTRLFPYLRGLAALAESEGRPLLLHPALLYPPMSHENVEWSDMDAWMLGSALYVAPILERGATSREVALPEGEDWYDWWTGEEVSEGTFSAELDEILVFAAGGSIVPTFTEVPDTLIEFADGEDREPGLVDLADANAKRTLTVFGTGGSFEEADGTTYAVTGTASAAGESTQALSSGMVEVGGVSVEITGAVEREYRVVVWP